MAEPLDNYISSPLAAAFRRQAWKAWAFVLFVAGVWTTFIISAPLARAAGIDGFADSVYHFFGHVCHQMPERSFFLDGHPLAVCSRCFGVYFGLVAGFVAYPFFRRVEEVEPLPRFWLFLAMIPIGVDWSLGVFNIWENTHLSRFLTGLLLGFACAVFITPAVVEIVRLASGRAKRKRLSS